MTKDEFQALYESGENITGRLRTLYQVREVKNGSDPLGLIADEALALELQTKAAHVYLVEPVPFIEFLDTKVPGGDSVWVRANISTTIVDTPETLDGQISDVLPKISVDDLVKVLEVFTLPTRKNTKVENPV